MVFAVSQRVPISHPGHCHKGCASRGGFAIASTQQTQCLLWKLQGLLVTSHQVARPLIPSTLVALSTFCSGSAAMPATTDRIPSSVQARSVS
jgi:hypothetical protein